MSMLLWYRLICIKERETVYLDYKSVRIMLLNDFRFGLGSFPALARRQLMISSLSVLSSSSIFTTAGTCTLLYWVWRYFLQFIRCDLLHPRSSYYVHGFMTSRILLAYMHLSFICIIHQAYSTLQFAKLPIGNNAINNGHNEPRDPKCQCDRFHIISRFKWSIGPRFFSATASAKSGQNGPKFSAAGIGVHVQTNPQDPPTFLDKKP
jgi:hypothetical protein